MSNLSIILTIQSQNIKTFADIDNESKHKFQAMTYRPLKSFPENCETIDYITVCFISVAPPIMIKIVIILQL